MFDTNGIFVISVIVILTIIRTRNTTTTTTTNTTSVPMFLFIVLFHLYRLEYNEPHKAVSQIIVDDNVVIAVPWSHGVGSESLR
jgi:hypothetical protein